VDIPGTSVTSHEMIEHMNILGTSETSEKMTEHMDILWSYCKDILQRDVFDVRSEEMTELMDILQRHTVEGKSVTSDEMSEHMKHTAETHCTARNVCDD
jgi:hypothetical protein